MSEHDEELLERALTGDLDRNSPEWLEALERNPQLRQRWVELTSIERELGFASDDEIEAVRRAQGESTERDRAVVAAAFAKAGAPASPTPARSRTVRWRPSWLSAVAALLVVSVGLAVWWNTRTPGPQPTPHNLSGLPPTCKSPLKAVSAIDAFRWEAELPPGGHFEVVVYERNDDGSKGRELARSAALYDCQWTPDAAQLAAIQRAIVWRVIAYAATSGTFESNEASAWLSPH